MSVAASHQKVHSGFQVSLDFLKSKRLIIIYMVVLLFLLSAVQGLLVLILGPFIMVFLKLQSSSSTIDLISLFPKQVASYFEGFGGILLFQKNDLVLWIPIVLCCLGVARSLLGFLYQVCSQTLSVRFAETLRNVATRKIMSLNFEALSKKSRGEWLSMLTTDILYIQSKFSEILIGLLKEVSMVFGAVVAVWFVSYLHGVLLLVFVPIVFFLLRIQAKKISFYADWWQGKLRVLVNEVLDLRKRLQWAVVNGGRDYEKERFANYSNDYYSAMKRSFIVRGTFAPAVEWIGMIGLAGFVYYTSQSADHNTAVHFKDMIPLLASFALVIKPLRSIGDKWGRVEEVKGALKELDSVLRIPNSKGMINENKDLQHSQLDIGRLTRSFENQTFKLIVEDFSTESGTSYGLVGQSGCGKSTFLKILAGLMLPDEWEAKVTIHNAVDRVNYVGQNSFLFPGTIRANLYYGLNSENLSESVVKKCLEVSGFNFDANFLDREIKHYGERGISGGEAQRLFLARALLRQIESPSLNILVLDEITSGLDSKSEFEILSSLLDFVRENHWSLIFVTHRISAMKLLDQVIYFENGSIVAKGSHDSLVESNQSYQEFTSMDQGS